MVEMFLDQIKAVWVVKFVNKCLCYRNVQEIFFECRKLSQCATMEHYICASLLAKKLNIRWGGTRLPVIVDSYSRDVLQENKKYTKETKIFARQILYRGITFGKNELFRCSDLLRFD